MGIRTLEEVERGGESFYSTYFELQIPSPRCQRLEQRYILLACKYEALAKRHKELERYQQKQAVLNQMERTVSQVRWRGRGGAMRGGKKGELVRGKGGEQRINK